jgi:hypothetical protein
MAEKLIERTGRGVETGLGYKLISIRPYFSLLIQLINSFEVSSYALCQFMGIM